MQAALRLVALVFLVSATADAQAPAINAGARVRVTSKVHDYNRRVATVSAVRRDSLVLFMKKGNSATVALSDIDRMQVSVGRRRMVLRGMLAGGLIGAVTGAAAGAATYEECKDQICFLTPVSAGEAAAGGATILGVVGVAVGGVIGALVTTDRWGPATVPGTISVAPSPGGRVAVGLTRTF